MIFIDALLLKIKDNDCLCVRCFGLKFCKIQIILNEVKELFESLKPKQGRHRKLESLFCVLMYLYFLKNYCSLEKLGLMFNVSTSTAWRYVKFMTSVFENLECLNNIFSEDSKFLLVDGTETEVERPLSNVNFVYYYGRKKKFSVKTQVVVDPLTMNVVSIECCEGSMHDFELFKYTYDGLCIKQCTCLIADAGYVGIRGIHSNSFSILKKPPKGVLNAQDRVFNRCVSNFRVKNEHVIGKLKCWKVFKGVFRHCKWLLSSFYRYARIVSSLYNFGLG